MEKKILKKGHPHLFMAKLTIDLDGQATIYKLLFQNTKKPCKADRELHYQLLVLLLFAPFLGTFVTVIP